MYRKTNVIVSVILLIHECVKLLIDFLINIKSMRRMVANSCTWMYPCLFVCLFFNGLSLVLDPWLEATLDHRSTTILSHFGLTLLTVKSSPNTYFVHSQDTTKILFLTIWTNICCPLSILFKCCFSNGQVTSIIWFRCEFGLTILWNIITSK